jgi:peptidoglycan/LPS O-acetylase OafA/YrhL
MIIRSNDFVPSRFVTTAWIVLFITLPAAFLTDALGAQWIVFSMSAVASASLVYLSLFAAQKWLHWILKNRFVVYTGTISYGLYLLHKIPFDFGATMHFDKYPFVAAPILFAATYGIAALSWNFLEKPFLNLKRFFVTQPDPSRRKVDSELAAGV